MEHIDSITDLMPGSIIDNKTLTRIFKCSPRGGMRRSLKTNSLVLLSIKNRAPYENIKEEGELLLYTGMGRKGDQSLDYMQNKTLLHSNEMGVKVYLFEVEDDKYTFIDRVILGSPPKKEIQLDIDEKSREVWLFPLLKVGNTEEVFHFLQKQARKVLEGKNIISYPKYELSLHSVDPLSQLMIEKGIDTLIGPGGWYFTSTQYFYNPNTKSKHKIGNIKSLSETQNIKKGIVFENQNKFINPFFLTAPEPLNNNLQKIIPNFKEGKFLMRKIEYKYPHKEWISVQFVQGERRSAGPFTTLMIGPNGTGKSTVLSNIQKILLDVYNYKKSSTKTHMSREIDYTLEYQIGKNIYTIINENRKRKFFEKGKEISLNSLRLPRKLIASAFSINDRFTFMQQSEEPLEEYSYLGIKSSDNVARVGETSKNLVLNIVSSSQKGNFTKMLKYIMEYVELCPVIKIKYRTKANEKLKDIITENNVFTLQNKFLKKIKKTELLNTSFTDHHEILEFIHKFSNKDSRIFSMENDTISITFNLNDHERYYEYYDEFHMLWHLFEIGILEAPVVYIKKKDFFKLEDASSGESQYLSTMINILSKIDKDSLVLIDEPEISLHPNWQNKYIHGIKEIFKHNYSSCHFILATHSHFMVSDLEKGMSSLVSLELEKEFKTKIRLRDEETFGWSVEDVLLNIFGMATDRNYYLADELDKLLLEISIGEITEGMKSKVKELNRMSKNLKAADPLKEVIALISSKVEIEE